MQSDLSVENALFRLKPKSGFLTQSRKGFFDSTFSTENSDWRIQSKKSIFSTGSFGRKTQSKKFYTCFFNRSHRPSHHQTHTHTATYPYQVPHCSTYKALTLAWLSLLLLLAARQPGTFLVPLASSVYHSTAAARGLDLMLPTTAAPAVALVALGWVQLHERSFGGFRLSPKPSHAETRVRRGVARGESGKHKACNRFRLVCSRTTSHQLIEERA